MRQIILAAAATVLLTVAPARAEMTEVEIIFVRTDKNGDLVLNKTEVLLRTLEQFDETDSDRNNFIEKSEAGDLADKPEFNDNDTNKDGQLSVEEVIEEKLADFKAADTNSDGMLTVEEVTKFYEDKQ